MHHRNNRLRTFAFLVATLVVLASGSSAFGEGDGYGQALSERLGGIATMHARFEQFTVNREDKIRRHQRGELWVAKPDRFRIVTESPWAQTLVSNGQTFWSYDQDLEQVIINDLGKNIREVPILLLGGDPASIASQYQVGFFSEGEIDHFVLEPRKQNSLFASLTVEFRDELPVAIVIRDNLGQQTRMEFIEPALNVDIAESRFVFEPPPDVDVIDDRPDNQAG